MQFKKTLAAVAIAGATTTGAAVTAGPADAAPASAAPRTAIQLCVRPNHPISQIAFLNRNGLRSYLIRGGQCSRVFPTTYGEPLAIIGYYYSRQYIIAEFRSTSEQEYVE